MALVVEQRPEAELFVEENPTIYDTPYFTSRWNSANLPLVYKISNTKFPVNTEDTIESILTIESNGGFAQLNLDTTTFTFLNKGYVEVTNTTNYDGVWQIREVVNVNTIVISAPFVADETGNVQNYYNNYNTLVKVYSGLPEYHPLNSTNPMTLITDNPITITPNSDNEAVIDVASLIKSKINLNNDYEVNDLNLFTASYIEFAEQFDESDGTNVTTSTSAFTIDLIEGCDSSSADFVVNGDFSDGFNNWDDFGPGNPWSEVSGEASVSVNSFTRRSQTLFQNNINLTYGTEYTISFDYTNDGGLPFRLSVSLGFSTVFQTIVTDTSGTISFNNIFQGASPEEIGVISFNVEVQQDPLGTFFFTLDNISILNNLINPCIAYTFATHSAQQPQYKYGGNMGEYVQNFNGGVFANRWLTLFEKPVLFKNNYFDLSTIIPQAVIQSAIQAGGFFLEIVEFDRNGTAIEENQYPITQNLGDGVYRFRLDDKSFNTNTKEFTAQILRIPVNLFVDGDQGTFDTTTDSAGNPPSDWNLEKDTRAIINFDNTLSFEGAGSLKFDSRSIFNDNYGLNFLEDGQSGVSNFNYVNYGLLSSFDIQSQFSISLKFYPFDLPNNVNQDFNSILGSLIGDGITEEAIRLECSENKTTGVTRVRFALEQPGSDINIVSEGTLIKNQVNTIIISYENGVSASLNVNGNINTNNSPPDYTGFTTIENGWFSGNNVLRNPGFNPKNIDGVIQDLIFDNSSTIKYQYNFNQEQGAEIFETVSQLFEDILVNFTISQLQFGGGVWVDVTTL